MAVRCVRPGSPAQWGEARRLVEEYAFALGLGVCFLDLGQELAQMEVMYGPPGGVLFLARDGDEAVGCAGLRRLSADDGEIKRLYVAPSRRGAGIGRLLAQRAIAAGRELGYRRLLLDTLPAMQAAQALYRSLGFLPTAPYGDHPAPGTVCMALELN